MGGMKRKIAMEKIEKKDSRSVAFSKRRNGLYSKASELCLLSRGSQVAILATPVSSKSNVSFYSFGHSSVDGVVSSFLANQRPPREEDLGLGFWWEDESLAKSEDSNELRDAVDSISRMLRNLKGLHSAALKNQGNLEEEDLKKMKKKKKKKEKKEEDVVIHELDRNQTLNLQSPAAASICTHDEGFVKNSSEEQEDHILTISHNNNNDDDNGLLGSLDGFNEVFDLDQIFDFVTKSEGESTNLETDDVAMMMVKTNQRDVDEDFCDELASIAPL